MKKGLLTALFAPLGLYFIVGATPAQAEITEADRTALREKTIHIAQKTIDCVFPQGAAKDPFLATTYEKLRGFLDELPTASYQRRDEISKEAYGIRINLEIESPEWRKDRVQAGIYSSRYKYNYVKAAHTVMVAAQVGTYVAKNGHQSSHDIVTGDKDEVSYALTQDASDGALYWHKDHYGRKCGL